MIITVVKPDQIVLVDGRLARIPFPALPEGVRIARIDVIAGSAEIEYEKGITYPVTVRDHAAEDAATDEARKANNPEPDTPLYKTVQAQKEPETISDLSAFAPIIQALT